VHKKYLDRYVATFEVMTNAKRFTPVILQRMSLLQKGSQSDST